MESPAPTLGAVSSTRCSLPIQITLVSNRFYFRGRVIRSQQKKISSLSNGGLFRLENPFVLEPGEED